MSLAILPTYSSCTHFINPRTVLLCSLIRVYSFIIPLSLIILFINLFFTCMYIDIYYAYTSQIYISEIFNIFKYFYSSDNIAIWIFFISKTRASRTSYYSCSPSFSFHRYPRLPLVLSLSTFSAQLEITCKLVSQSALSLCVFDASKCTDVEFVEIARGWEM